jgi:hypothetical protein
VFLFIALFIISGDELTGAFSQHKKDLREESFASLSLIIVIILLGFYSAARK